MLGFRMEEISALINDINIVTKINCVLFDRDFNLLHDYKDSMCRLCNRYCRRFLLGSLLRRFRLRG